MNQAIDVSLIIELCEAFNLILKAVNLEFWKKADCKL